MPQKIRQKMTSMDFIIILFHFLLISSPTIFVHSMRNESRCGSVDIRNNPKMAFQPRQYTKTWMKYKECTILEGDFTISMITHSNVTDEMFPVFENLREITGSILVFQIRGLLSLGRMFPNLRVIGGHSLIMNYALVIYQNYDLRDVGLTKLTAIKNGGVRITENPRLCYTKSINWNSILVGKIRDLIIDQVAGQCKNDCPTVEDDDGRCQKNPLNGQIACWNSTHCQRACKNAKRPDSGCTDVGDEPCHEECIGGCTRPNDNGACFSCRNLDWDGVCVANCPNHLFEQLGRRCLTKAECENLYPVAANPSQNEKSVWKPFRKQCHYECPNNFHEDPDNPYNCVKCTGYCPKRCLGETVDSIGSALKFSKCNMIEGNLEIDMRIGVESTPAEKFAEAFGEIEEITGYLLIRFSTAFMSLHMFKKLRVIHGQQLWKNMYALVVFENPNLHTLFDTESQALSILRGKVYFNNNRMLCYKKVTTLIEHLKLREEVTESDVSQFSNGDKAICDEIPLEMKIVSVYAYGFVVSWTPFNTTDMDHRKFLGYQIFYKKVEKMDVNMSINDDRSACSDSWYMQFVSDDGDVDDFFGDELGTAASNSPKGELVHQGIEANTLYAVYVQTRLVNHPGARNAISKIHFVKTLFNVPDPPRMRESYAIGPHSLKLVWDPPLEAYGDITHYMISWNLAVEYNTVKQTDVCTGNKHATANLNNKPPSFSSLIATQSTAKDTCPREMGCCKCDEGKSEQGRVVELSSQSPDANLLSDERKESSSFEDALQNTIFVQNCDISQDSLHCADHQSSKKEQSEKPKLEQDLAVNRAKRHRRHELARAMAMQRVGTNSYGYEFAMKHLRQMPSGPSSKFSSSASVPATSRRRRSLPFENGTKPLTSSTDTGNRSVEQLNENAGTRMGMNEINVSDIEFNAFYNFSSGKINITGTSILLTGLPHFSEYHITVYACQDVTAIDHYCSGRPAWTAVRTEPIPEYDQVDPNTVTLMNATEDRPNEKRIYWMPPETPNGFVLAYRARLIRDDESTPLDRCIAYETFENESGVVFSGLPDGTYTLEIRVDTTSLLTNNVTVIRNLFVLYTPGFFTLEVILIMAGALLVVLSAIGVALYFFMNHMFGKKVEEYWRQTISANPDYLSQMELYKADEWELKREDIVLEQEIGRGTFGKVFRGYGKNVQSFKGEVFGDCAVKTVPETANNAERLHFLIEASYMKQFNTAFIVKLYGVVSDGQPVLVVMELMEKGNLRDFLRSHRPDAEENKTNRPLPTAEQYFTWAAEIADGMAYLESLKFCHRDLAARNCMVHANESVKIGDFGMARDLYYQEYYKPAGKRLMPVRWMAPESLKDGKFTMKSDVWSYGIVLYEMLTLGQQPYAGLGNDQVFNYTGVQRHVLQRPTGCPDFWYGIMLLCWKYDARERPCFYQIVRYLEKYATEDFRRMCFVLNEKIGVEKSENYNFDVNLDHELHGRNNIYNEEFMYGQDEDEEEDGAGGMGDFISEEELCEMQHPVCVNNRRSFDKVFNGDQQTAMIEQDDMKVESPGVQERIDLSPNKES